MNNDNLVIEILNADIFYKISSRAPENEALVYFRHGQI